MDFINNEKDFESLCEAIEKFYDDNGHSPDVYDDVQGQDRILVISNSWESDSLGWASSLMEINLRTGETEHTIEYEEDAGYEGSWPMKWNKMTLEEIASDIWEYELGNANEVEHL